MAFPRSQIQAVTEWLRRMRYPSPEIQSLIDWREKVLRRPDVEVISGSIGSFLCRPGELLVAEELADRVPSLVHGDLPEPTHLGTVPILHYRSPRIQVRQVLERAREFQRPDEPPLRIGPNLVFTGEQAYQGFPGGWPTAEVPESPDFSGPNDGPIVAVLDTGYTKGPHTSDGLNDRFGTWGPPTADEDLDVTPPHGWRDFEAGHATFICGIIAQRARRAQLHLTPTLNSNGDVDEVELLRRIEELPADVNVVNLSLGGHSPTNQAPVLLRQALAKLAPETAVLAAAGNAGPSELPFWPAALDREEECEEKVVFAVGATDPNGTKTGYSTEPADLYAPGRSVSAFIEFNEKDHHSGRLHGRDPQTFEGYASWEGTSFATAIAAAAIVNGMAAGETALEVARRLCREGEVLGLGEPV
jgi:hypothetical protein